MPFVPNTRINDISGTRFGRWEVLRFSHVTNKNKSWLCRCDCGTERAVPHSGLVCGASKSCGCLQKERASAASYTHGMSQHPAYKSWQHLRNRCLNPNDRDFRYYGGRGIGVCENWKTFNAFWQDMGTTWALGLTIERIDVNRDYCPENCTWITQAKQSRNTSRSIRVEMPDGRVLNIADAADELGIKRPTLQRRYHQGLRGPMLFARDLREKL